MSVSSKTAASASTRGLLLADAQAGFLVFLIALPLCLGISVASGFPPIAGIMTAIIGGLIVSPLSGSALTIKGPAAGMIVIVLGAVTELGAGDPLAGYHRALAVGVVAAIVQMALAALRTARFGITLSRSVVHGMLAAIGIIIISKQIHVMVGVKPASKEILGLIAEIPNSLIHANPLLAGIGLLSIAILVAWPKIRRGAFMNKIPAQLVVLIVVIPLAILCDIPHAHPYHFFHHDYTVSAANLVQLPASILSGIAFPDFSMIMTMTSVKYIIMFALVGTIESTLSVVAIDGIDPKHRTSKLDKDLFALAVGNLISSLIGGLPMISEIVRSKANVDAGANSAKANAFHGLFLLVFVATLPSLLQLIPLAALAAMLVFVGFRLASPNEFRHMYHIGADQLLLFLVTLVMTLATDLLIGVGTGIALKIALHMMRGGRFGSLFRPVIHSEQVSNETMRMVIHGAAAFPSLIHVKKALQSAPAHVRHVEIDAGDAVLVDHTFLSGLAGIFGERPQISYEVVGLEKFRAASHHPEATRWRGRNMYVTA
ncbi:MAG: SulP family inorganic anion transporter [Alphaproteobacteria bacterium]|nr:MAG: SulP family inorganic anion transporter [Alphaproteobacteria bacterium]